MSEQRNQAQLEALRAAQQRFAAELKRFESAERWRRSFERSKEFRAQGQKAIQYLEMALGALEEDGDAQGNGRSGWLSRRVQGLAKYLTSNTEEPVEAQSMEELASSSLVFSGDCGVMELPDLIGVLQAQTKTGRLLLTNKDEIVHLHFQNGDLVHAYSENTPPESRLGEVLVAMGAVTEERLQSLLFCNQSSPKMLGQLLLEGSVVAPEVLQEALVNQIQGLFDRLFAMREETTFRFEPGLAPMPENRARLNVLQLLFESARKHDERQAG